MAVRNGKRPQPARLLFDYQDVNNHKAAGLRTDAGQSQIPVRGQRWVFKVVQDGGRERSFDRLRAGCYQVYQQQSDDHHGLRRGHRPARTSRANRLTGVSGTLTASYVYDGKPALSAVEGAIACGASSRPAAR